MECRYLGRSGLRVSAAAELKLSEAERLGPIERELILPYEEASNG